MKHKLLTILLTLVATLCLALGLTACNFGSSGNTDNDGSNSEQNGEQTPEHIHTYTVDNVCSDCGAEWKYTEGLEYEFHDKDFFEALKNSDESWKNELEDYPYDLSDGAYYVTSVGSASGDIVIPYGHEGKRVFGVAGRTLRNFDPENKIKTITFSGSVALVDLCYEQIEKIVFDRKSSASGYMMFFGENQSLKEIVLPDHMKVIVNHAFQNCSGLKSITIPDSVTGIGDSAFYNCSGLTSVTIGSSVTSIGDRAFYDCSGLTSIEIPCRCDLDQNSGVHGLRRT